MRHLLVLLLCGCDTPERVERWTAPAPERALVVDVDAGDVRIVGGEGTEVSVERVVRGATDQVEVSAEVVDGALELRGVCPVLLPCGVDLVVRVPAGLTVDVRSGSGKIELFELEGEARVELGDGSVSALGLGAGPLRVQVGWGDVTAAFSAEPAAVRVGAGGGDVSLLLPAGGYALDVDGLAGEQVAGVAVDPAGPRVHVRATSGRVFVGRQ